MNISMTAENFSDHAPRARTPHAMPVVVQIISTLMFGAFAIVAVIFAFNTFWPGGLVLAAILGWRGGFVPNNFTQVSAEEIAEKVRALSPEARQRTSGNASFDAYRGDVLRRLEEEQDSFENFLGRLRDAKDRTEFDTFMDERATKSRLVGEDD